jgi:long-subunit acyl-CoA synthetase (AMP-forming)
MANLQVLGKPMPMPMKLEAYPVTALQFQARGMKEIGSAGDRILLPDVNSSDVATLVFTSGTTAFPKAVALTHSNLVYQIESFPRVMQVRLTVIAACLLCM